MQRNKILCFFATIIIAAVTIYAVFRGGGVSLWTACREYQGCIGSGDCTFLYQYVWLLSFFEGEALRRLFFIWDIRQSIRMLFVYSAADIYFSAITPSASGGQPASAFL